MEISLLFRIFAPIEKVQRRTQRLKKQMKLELEEKHV